MPCRIVSGSPFAGQGGRRMSRKKRKVARVGYYKDFFASGVKVGKLITLSGQVSIDADGKTVGAGDLEAQVAQAYANVKQVLAEFDASMDDIVDEMWLVTDVKAMMKNLQRIWAIRREAYGGDPEVTQTTVEVSSLVSPELMIEIKCIARG
jgi:enamine deaminase RidA (YjgF/YER057c/UK114 family)